MSFETSIDKFVRVLVEADIPVRAEDNREGLKELNAKLPKRISRPFESFLSRYSFPEFDVCGITLFGWNSSWESTKYLEAVSAPKNSLAELLLPAGYLQIGRPDTGDFDAICFDLNDGGDQRIVQADHEEILCNCRVKITAELWPSFITIVEKVLSGVDCGLHFEEPLDDDAVS
jgi:hypothetical protein